MDNPQCISHEPFGHTCLPTKTTGSRCEDVSFQESTPRPVRFYVVVIFSAFLISVAAPRSASFLDLFQKELRNSRNVNNLPAVSKPDFSFFDYASTHETLRNLRSTRAKNDGKNFKDRYSHSIVDSPDQNRNEVDDLCSLECCTSIFPFGTDTAKLASFVNITSPIRRRTEEDKPEACSSEGSFAWVNSVPFGVQILLISFLVMFSGIFSGLTLGLMGLGTTELEIVMSGDDPVASRAAAKIYPIRAKSNLLLCTLLLGNVGVNTLLGIIMADITGGIVGFTTSTIIIVIFGEILPQAAFSRHALVVGEKAVPLVKVIIIILYPMAKPLAFCLDKLLGDELGTTYSKSEMNKLLEIHVKEGRFNQETGTAMKGALKYQDISVKEVMTPLEHTFMLNVEEKLNFDTIATIFKTGYSRIPVYEASVFNVIGLLFVKDLIFVDPEDETPIRNFVQIFGRGVHVVWPDDKLGDVLRDLKKGHSHMALVRDVNNEDETQDPFYEIKGIITLEDIIEIIIGDDIVDETDAWVDAEHSIKVNRVDDFDWARLRLLDAKIVDQNLSEEEVRAVTAHLRTNHTDAVSPISDKQLLRMIAATAVTEFPTAVKEIGEVLPADLIYEKGKPSDVCTLVLSGKISILVGSDNFRSDVSSWSVLATKALTNRMYEPDFSAYVSSGPCRCLRIKREIFTAAVDASKLEKLPIDSLVASKLGAKTSHTGTDEIERPVSLHNSTNDAVVSNSSFHEGQNITSNIGSKDEFDENGNSFVGNVDDSKTHPSVHSESSSGARDAIQKQRSQLLAEFFDKKTKNDGGKKSLSLNDEIVEESKKEISAPTQSLIGSNSKNADLSESAQFEHL